MKINHRCPRYFITAPTEETGWPSCVGNRTVYSARPKDPLSKKVSQVGLLLAC